ncbi:hypothetical protein BH10BAC5_BH10BAC5_25750 [soil metagenome]
MKIKTSFSPSANIVRDDKFDLNFIPTANSNLVFEGITKNYFSGLRSFYLVGNYGTGKSTFLLALKKTITKEYNYFKSNKYSKSLPKFETFVLAEILLAFTYTPLSEPASSIKYSVPALVKTA